MDEEFAKVLTELLNGLEEAIRRAREELSKAVAKELSWETVEAKQPVDEADKAIQWLIGRLKDVKAKHPDVSYEFVRNQEGRITGLKFNAADEEAKRDVREPTKWAFDKAAQRPFSASKSKEASKA